MADFKQENDIQPIFFNNLILLGFDPAAMEIKHKTPFTKEMFSVPNRKGAEVILYFLFNKLDPVGSKEIFRNCWPIFSKKDEQQFRKNCCNWTKNIAKEDLEAHFPRVNASLFLSPGGNKFYYFLFCLSRYILHQTNKKENGLKQGEYLHYPSLTSRSELNEICRLYECAIIFHQRHLLDYAQQKVLVYHKWRNFASSAVKEYRQHSKTKRHLQLLKQQKERNTCVKTSVSDSEYNDRLYLVSQQWKKVKDVCNQLAADQAVIRSVLETESSKYSLDAEKLNVKIPDLLLKNCEKEIHEDGIQNIYQEGKLNILSVIQLWNLSLCMYIQRIQEVCVPEFYKYTDQLNDKKQILHTHFTEVQGLINKMKNFIPKLASSVKHQETVINQDLSGEMNSQRMGTKMMDFGLSLSLQSSKITDWNASYLGSFVELKNSPAYGKKKSFLQSPLLDGSHKLESTDGETACQNSLFSHFAMPDTNTSLSPTQNTYEAISHSQEIPKEKMDMVAMKGKTLDHDVALEEITTTQTIEGIPLLLNCDTSLTELLNTETPQIKQKAKIKFALESDIECQKILGDHPLTGSFSFSSSVCSAAVGLSDYMMEQEADDDLGSDSFIPFKSGLDISQHL